MVEFAAPVGLSSDSPVSTVVHGSDEGLAVEFYKNPVDGKDHIIIPIDKTFAPDYIVDERHKMRFPRQWKAYQDNTDQLAGQTRLEEVAWIDVGTRRQFQASGVFTLEGLANASDSSLQFLGLGSREFRNRAQAEVEAKRKLDNLEASEAEKRDLEAKLSEMQAQIDALTPKRGRPRKEASEETQ